jgi:hypothetical protein
MKQSYCSSSRLHSHSVQISGALGLLLTLGLLLASSASATYEQVATFADEIGNKQLINVSGMAVNYTGAGGVPAGTVYAVQSNSPTPHVETYNAKGEFREAWGSDTARGIAIDQATGNVYVLSERIPGQPVVSVFSPDGAQLLTSFAEHGAQGETVDEGPDKVHGVVSSGIAVNNSGVVYVSDQIDSESRIMQFEPQSPGDYEHYVYAGRSHDVAAPQGGIKYEPRQLSLDSAGNLYTVRGNSADRIFEFSPGEPHAPACEYQLPSGGIFGLAVNPASGEVFYFSYSKKNIHRLNACNSEGEFVESGSPTPVSPKTEEISALAFNPVLSYEPFRPPGVLYAAHGSEEYKGLTSAEVHGRGFIFAPPEVHSPSVESESISSVTATTATLNAQINPEGSQARYAFQYLTEDAYEANEAADRFAGATEAPLGGAELGSGQSPLGAAVALSGLQPDTEYRYRVAATSHCNPSDEEEVCEGIGADAAFRTFPLEAPGLPDSRAWELVSPPQKQGGEVFPADPRIGSCTECKPGELAGRFPMQSSPDGEAVVYEGLPFSFSEGAVLANEYVSKRNEKTGWQTTILSPSLGASGSEQGYVAFNAKLSRGLLYQIDPALSPEAPSEFANLYTQDTANPLALSPLLDSEPPNRPAGDLQLTYAGASADFSRLFFEANDALSGETPFAPEALDGGKKKNNLYESAGGGLRLVNVLPGNAETAPGAAFGSGRMLSSGNIRPSDLSHAISADGSRVFWSDEAGQAYVRENGESTRAIPDPGKFLTASDDGSKVLLNDGHIYDLETEETTDLTEGKAGFQGIAGQSEDLSHIYFVDTAVLSGEEENDHGAKAQAGQNNLYAWHEGASAFVATLLPGDNPGGDSDGDWMPSLSQRTAEASPDGRWVAFRSRAPLSGYDNTGCGGNEIEPCQEVFLYDSVSAKLSCPSCNPSGGRPLGSSTLRLLGGAPGYLPQPRYLTDEGRLYFDSRDSLTPFDTNNGVEDVYQHEPEGVGSCKREAGCVSLISAGHEPIDSNFLAADSSGKNVFFTTRDQLVLKDRDELIDLYVAREGGGIASETETSRGECQGEACQPAISPPNDPTPGSSTFEGAGNVNEQKTAKKHKKKHKHAKKKQKSHKRSHGRANDNRGGAK